MPTARPIIIEKFIDHTDSGVPEVSRCSAAQPTKMPATARRRGIPAATAEPKAMNSKMTVGSPDRSSARCRACSFSALKSLHTAHSPVTLAVAPGRQVHRVDVVDQSARRDRAVGVDGGRELDGHERGATVGGDQTGVRRQRRADRRPRPLPGRPAGRRAGCAGPPGPRRSGASWW